MTARPVFVAAVIAHVLITVALLVAVATGAEVRLLVALLGGVIATVIWVLAASSRTAAEQVSTPPVRAVRPPGELPSRAA